MLNLPIQAAATDNSPLIVRIGGESSHFLAAPTFWSVSVIGTSRSLEGLVSAAFPSAVMALLPDGSLHTISQDGVVITLTSSIFGLQPEPMHAIAWGAPHWVVGSFFMR